MQGDRGERGATGGAGDQGEDGMPGDNVFSAGVVYTIWGKTECPSGAQTLTRGLAASPHHDDTGGGTNYMCLPDTPSFSATDSSAQVQTKVVGVTYQTTDEPLARVNDMSMPCAVCFVNQAVQLMVPGSAICPTNWDMEYKGYLMSAKDTPSETLQSDSSPNFRTEYICVASNAEGVSSAANEEAGIYHVHLDCDVGVSLSCSQSGYRTASQLTCSICTRPPVES